ncbi:hypothetical protein [Rubrivirga sp.]|uniref:hypothetical protein n=1 Tax=Rubrivirga sp. TaxID=1885344 RepID=UPI003B52257E
MRPTLLALALVLAACGDRPSATTAPATDEAASPTSADPDSVTISVEGTDQAVAVRRVRFEDVPLPFTTLVPERWADDVVSSGEGTAVRLTMGDPPRQGLVSVFVASEPDPAGAVERARAVAESYGEVREVASAEPWTVQVFAFSGPDAVGRVSVGEHAGVPFTVVESFPPELGDGFSPRASLVLDRLRWLDDDTGL